MTDDLEGYEYTVDYAPWAAQGSDIVLSLRADDEGT